MANDGKIYIIVTNQLPNGAPEPVPGSGTDKESKDKESTIGKFAQHKFFNFVQSEARQAINYSINNIGNFTGDYIAQAYVQNAMDIMSTGLDILNAGIAGLKLSGGSPWGAAIGAGIVVAGKMINTGQQLLSSYAETTRQNRAIDQLRTRAGLNSTNNGSRGTEY